MFLNRLFKKSDVLLKAKVNISESSTSFSILNEYCDVKDRELVLMGLLIYARVLRTESSKTEREKLTNIFIEFETNYRNSDNSVDYLNSMHNILSLLAKSNHFSDSAIIKLKKGRNIYLDMQSINVLPLTSVVYTVFNFLWEKISQENQSALLESFALLSRLYIQEKFSMASAVETPNMIVYEIIPFKK